MALKSWIGLFITIVIIVLAIGIGLIHNMGKKINDQHFSPSGKERFTFLYHTDGDSPSSLDDPSSLYLSLIIPAFNEEERLPVMLDETLAYLQERQKHDPDFTFELIIVDDGSSDATQTVGKEYISKYGSDTIRVLPLNENYGKGFAVKQGMLRGRGEYMLMVDADGATEFHSALPRLEREIQRTSIRSRGGSQLGIVVGSRAHLMEEAVAQRKWYRNILMYGFHFSVSLLSRIRSISDTQCGFKLFTRDSARLVFHNLHINRWCFDVEILYIAQQTGVPVSEVAVNWTEVAGSKLNLVSASLDMFKSLLVMRVMYMAGTWLIPPFP
eukprot:gb/GECH01011917.1/.p1 GENE.gb/GECH01011917.1/~~gb/GECH01011917.1/.p1  ORF type:complete len:327 (+),score=55.08 gb/GECH01011917.1/:1-981(+)